MFIPTYELHFKKNMELLKSMPDNSLDAGVMDCPYGLGKEPDPTETLKAWLSTGYHEITGSGFMGKKWDSFVPQPIFWKEVYRVLKPGGYVLAFFGTRTYDWGTMAIRLAGFEIRDCIQWIYGSGFPKSLDVSKAIDKQGPPGQQPFSDFAAHYEERRKAKGFTHAAVCKAGGFFGSVNHGGASVNWANGYGLPTTEQWEILQPLLELDRAWLENVKREEYERQVIGKKDTGNVLNWYSNQDEQDRGDGLVDITAPGSEDAKTWEGYGTALKPANEPICVARKPLIGTVAQNVLTHGCGAINLNGCRIEYQGESDYLETATKNQHSDFGNSIRENSIYGSDERQRENYESTGRFPANVIFDEEAAAVLDQQSGTSKSTGGNGSKFNSSNNNSYKIKCVTNDSENGLGYGDTGGASRFFYCAKSSKEERNYGCEGLELKDPASLTDFRPTLKTNPENWAYTDSAFHRTSPKANNHPTVKPIAVMRYLCRLVKTPFESCTIADMFMGSGTTGVACMLEGINFIGCDEDENSYNLSTARVSFAQKDYIKQQSQPKQAALFEVEKKKAPVSIAQTLF